MNTYEICLADWEPLLPSLAALLGAPYEPGEFDRAEEQFHARAQAHGPARQAWRLAGPAGQLTVWLEAFEGYAFGTLQATDAVLREGGALLWQAYLQQGGNPRAAEPPPR